jgi:hypothetical protein
MVDQKGKGIGKNGQCHWIPCPSKPGPRHQYQLATSSCCKVMANLEFSNNGGSKRKRARKKRTVPLDSLSLKTWS